MIVRTCLLISDDPDDHTEFSEALYEISDNTVLLSISDPGKAIDLLALKKCVPECIFLNMGLGRFRPDEFFTALADPDLRHVRVVAYGEAADVFNPGHPRISDVLGPDFSYSELKLFLQNLIGGEGKPAGN